MTSKKASAARLGQDIAKGAGWLVFLRFSVKSISIVSTMILARLLVPEDFGVYALAMSIFSFIELVRAFGFGMALIQNQNATREHYDTAWTIHLFFSFFAGTVLFLSATPMAAYLHEPRLVDVIHFLAVVFFADAFNNIGIIDFQKEMNFDKEFIRRILIKFGSFAVTIPLAFVLRSYWALLLGTLASTVIALVLSYVMHPFRPRLSLARWKELLHFSAWLQLNNLLRFGNMHIENFVVARISGAASVGLLAISKEIGTITSMELVEPINRAAYPAFSKVSSDRPRLREVYLDVFGSLAMVALPFGVGIAAVAPVIVPILLGERWIEAIPVIQVIAIASVFLALASSASYLFISLALQKINTILLTIKLCVLIGLLMVFVRDQGAFGAALSVLGAALVTLPVTLAVVCRTLEIRWSQIFRPVLRPLLAASLMFLAVNTVYLGSASYESWLAGFLLMLFAAILGFFVFTVSLLVMWLLRGRPEGVEATFLKAINGRIALPAWLMQRSGD